MTVSHRRILMLCFLVATCEGIDLQAAGVAAEGLRAIFRPSPLALSLFFAGGTIGLFAGALIGGRLSDTHGRQRVLVISVALFGLFSLCTPFAADMRTLIGLRILTGLGLGGALPNVIALALETAPDHVRQASVATVYSGTPFGGAVASAVSLAAGPAHWEAIFIVGGVAPLILLPVILRALPESPAFILEREARRSGGSAVAGAHVGVAVNRFGALFADGRALGTVLLWASFFLSLLTLYLLLNWLPTLLRSAGIGTGHVAAIQIGFNLGGAIAVVSVGRFLEGSTRRATVLAVFAALPLVLYALARVPDQFLTLFSIVFVLGCLEAAGQAFFYSTAPAGYPTAIRGFGVGAAIAAGRLGSALGPLLGGLLVVTIADSSEVLITLLPLAIIASLLAILLESRTRNGGSMHSSLASAPRPEPADTPLLDRLATGHIVAAALHVVLRLDIPDRLSNGPRTIAELARDSHTHEDALYRVIRALASVGVFEEVSSRRFTLTPAGQMLRRDVPGNYHALALWWTSPFGFQVFSALTHSVHTGAPAVEKVTGMPIFTISRVTRKSRRCSTTR
jgi:AAHS family 3-hydroxyphenylpropionic acid transporter